MNQDLKNTYKHMRELGLAALAHANWHANYLSFENHMWSQLSVLQAAHAAEILIKARIAQEHPLLIFETLPKSSKNQAGKLDFLHLVEGAKTIQYSELPDRLWATTGIKIKSLEIFKQFGNLRNCIQHFANPVGKDCSVETIKFIYDVIDPFINECWQLYAVDYNEDTEQYLYLISSLITRNVDFLVPPKVLQDCLTHIQLQWGPDQAYKTRMVKRFSEAGYTI